MKEQEKEYASYLLGQSNEMEKTIANLEKLRPKPFEHMMTLGIYAAALIGVCYFTDNLTLIENHGFFAFMAMSALLVAESKRSNDRIDCLVKILKAKNCL